MSRNPYEDHITANLRVVADQAASLMADLKAGRRPEVIAYSVDDRGGRLVPNKQPTPITMAQIKRWAIQELRNCAVYWRRPPPVELAELVAQLLDPGTSGKSGRKPDAGSLSHKKFVDAVEYKAKHPDADANAIASALEYDQRAQIRGWLKQDDFRRQVVLRRGDLRAQRLLDEQHRRNTFMELLKKKAGR